MQTFVIPDWVWANLVLLVAPAILVGVKLAMEKPGRQKKESPPIRR